MVVATESWIDDPVYLIIGPANSGKTSLFNTLTGSQQRVANYPGVTHEASVGSFFDTHGKRAVAVDLPGIEDCTGETPAACTVAQYLKRPAVCAVCVIDLTQLDKSLKILGQLIEWGVPSVCVITMADVAARRGIQFDHSDIDAHVPVIVGDVRKREILARLKPWFNVQYLKDNFRKTNVNVIKKCLSYAQHRRVTLTERIDAIALHPIGGWIFLTSVLLVLSLGVFVLARGPMSWIQGIIFYLTERLHGLPAGLLRDLFVDGILVGVGNVLTYLPQIIIVSLFLDGLSNSGYLMRVAKLLDRPMRRIGLSGIASVPLLCSCACTVPGILACRSLPSARERVSTIFVAPWITCSARLPFYFILLATIFPGNDTLWIKAWMLLLMYGLGFAMAFLTSFMLKMVNGSSKSKPLLVDFYAELPAYRLPDLGRTLRYLWYQCKEFVVRAGTVILALSVFFGWLIHYPKVHNEPPRIEQSYLGRVGICLDPILKPLDYDWKIGVGLMSAFAARESFVSTLSILYASEHVDGASKTLPELLRLQKRPDGTPMYTVKLCISLALFFAFAMQCLTTLYLVGKETKSIRWPLAQFILMTGTAYLVAWLIANI